MIPLDMYIAYSTILKVIDVKNPLILNLSGEEDLFNSDQILQILKLPQV